jgi:hypothetical protein
MGKNNQHRREPQRPPGRQQIVSGPLVAVEAADAAAFAGQLKDKSKFPFVVLIG